VAQVHNLTVETCKKKKGVGGKKTKQLREPIIDSAQEDKINTTKRKRSKAGKNKTK
jgi:hypothetical protein